LAQTATNLDHVAVHRHGLKHRGPTAAETEGAPDGEVLHPMPKQEDAETVQGLEDKDTTKVSVDDGSAGVVDNAAAGQTGSQQEVDESDNQAKQWESENDQESTAQVDHLEAPQLGMQSVDGVPVDVVSKEEVAKFDDQHVDGPKITSAEVPSARDMESKELFKATGLKTKDLQDAANGVDTHIHRVDQAIDKVDGAMEKYHKSINGLAVNFGSLQKMAKDMHGEVLNEFQAREDERMCAFQNAERMMRGEASQPCHKATLEDSGHAPTSVTSRVSNDAELASTASGTQSIEEPSAQISNLVSAPASEQASQGVDAVEVMSHPEEESLSKVSEETPSQTQGAQDIESDADAGAQDGVNEKPTQIDISGPNPLGDGKALEKMSSTDDSTPGDGAKLDGVKTSSVE